MIPDSDQSPTAKASDALFKRIIIVSCALSLVTMYGWLACFDRQQNGDFYFHWRWIALLWIVIGLASNAFFWRKIWPPEGRAIATRKDIIIGSIVLGAPCLWWLTFPLRFLSGQHFWDVMTGLIAAAIVLSFGAWMVIKLIKAFEKSDADDLNALDTAEQNPKAAPTEK
jgi:FtsH-binding integral membrane protein